MIWFVHTPLQYEIVCLQKARKGCSVRPNSLRATNHKPENVLLARLLSLQAREKIGDMQKPVRKQDSIVSAVAKRLPPFKGTHVDSDFITGRISCWQGHLQRISPFLQYGEKVWWKYENNGFRLFQSDMDSESQPQGPKSFFSSTAGRS